jgi:mono/diheme cytochrome c family protein
VSALSECKAMIDPNITSNFLIRCESPASVSVDVYFEFNGVIQKIRYGPLTVAQISDTGVVVQPPAVTDKYKTGRELFAAKCMECHQSPYEKENKSFTQIKQSIQSVGEMNKLNVLTDAQIQAIRDYLNHLD